MLGVHLHIGLGCDLEHLVVSDGALWVGSVDLWPVGVIDAYEGHPVFHDAVRIRVVVVGCHETGVLLYAVRSFFLRSLIGEVSGSRSLAADFDGAAVIRFPRLLRSIILVII